MKRRIVTALLTAVLFISLPACGDVNAPTDTSVQAEPENTASEAAHAPEQRQEEANAESDRADIINDYNNTAELLEKFPVVNVTPVEEGIGEKIENRLLTGFENWNRGFDAWKAWGEILYTDDSIYNVHGARLTLAEYQDAMNATLSQMNLIMGDFNNMIICDDWAAIHYDITTVTDNGEKPGTVMEFVQFKDYGDELGTRVVEGWGGPKDASYEGMAHFQTEDDKKIQQEQIDKVLSYQIPEEADLKKKYPVEYPTKDNSDRAEQIKEALLKDFDAYNSGTDAYEAWAEEFFADAARITLGGEELDRAGYVVAVKEAESASKMTKLYFDNMLISGDWAAIHYRVTKEDAATGEREAADRMEFFHFDADGKVDIAYKK